MTNNANDFITRAYRQTGLIGQQVPTIPSYLMEQGLDMLNDIITEWAGDSSAIPYQREISFQTVPNQSRYTIGNGEQYDVNHDPVIDIFSMFYWQNPPLNTVRQRMQPMTEQQYASILYPESGTYPSQYLLREYPAHCELLLVSQPSLAFTMTIVGKFRFQKVTQFQDLGTIFPPNFLLNLKYRLVADLCDANTMPLTSEQIERRKQANSTMRGANKFDMTICKGETLRRSRYWGWWGGTTF